MILIFNANKISRSMSKSEWHKCWRWKRVTEKQLRAGVEAKLKVIRDVPDLPESYRRDIISEITNPPVVIFP